MKKIFFLPLLLIVSAFFIPPASKADELAVNNRFCQFYPAGSIGVPTGDVTLSSDCVIYEAMNGASVGNLTINGSAVSLHKTLTFDPGKQIDIVNGGIIWINTNGTIQQAKLCIKDADNDHYADTTLVNLDPNTGISFQTNPNIYQIDYALADLTTNTCAAGYNLRETMNNLALVDANSTDSSSTFIASSDNELLRLGFTINGVTDALAAVGDVQLIDRNLFTCSGSCPASGFGATYGNIYTAGKIGIGITNPASKISVGGVGLSTSSIYASTTGSDVSLHGANSGTGYAVYGTNSSTGIGVYGLNTNTGNGVQGTNSSGTGNGVYGYASTGGYGVYGYNASTGGGGYFTSASGGPSLVTGTGNVGIGLTNPTSKLAVGGQGNAAYQIYSTTASTNYSIFGTNSGAGYGVYGQNTSTGYGVYGDNTSTGYGGYFTSTSGPALVTNAGNVGIGRTNPTYKLHLQLAASSNEVGIGTTSTNISTSINGGYINFMNSGNSNSSAIHSRIESGLQNGATGYNAGGLAFLTAPVGAGNPSVITRMYIEPDGDVGIGITNPASKLELTNSADAVGIKSTTTYTGGNTNAIEGTATTSNTTNQNRAFYASATNAGGGPAYSFYGGSGLLYNADAVGIGISPYDAKLDIYRTDATYNSEWNAQLILRGADTDTKLILGADDTNDIGYISSMQRSQSWTTRNLAINPNGGNVGIGTISPVSKLHISGSSRFAGTLINTGASYNTISFNSIGNQYSMVPNSGFEVNDDATATIADGWFLNTNTTGTNPSVTTTTIQGARGQTLYGTATTNSSLLSTCFPITGGNAYNLYAWVLSSAASSGDGLVLRLYAYDDGACTTSGASYDAVTNGAVTTTWTKYGATVTPAASKRSAVIMIYNNAPNTTTTMTFDSITLVPSAVTSTIDLAENYYSSETLQAGQVVSADTSLVSGVSLADEENQNTLLGVVSTNPAITLGELITNHDKHLTKVALTGRVPVIVSTQNGTISIGDHLTSSTLAGTAAKQKISGTSLGTALESSSRWSPATCSPIASLNSIVWPSDNGSDEETRPCYRLPDGTYIGKLMTFVNLSWFEPKDSQISTQIKDHSRRLDILERDNLELKTKIQELERKINTLLSQ